MGTPVPATQRRMFKVRVTAATEDGVAKPIEVAAYASSTPGLWITQAIIDGEPSPNRWTVTHANTTKKIDGFDLGLPFETARFIAGALGGLPMDWKQKTYGDLARQWKEEMSEDLRRWVSGLTE